jgi:hypothetical protein
MALLGFLVTVTTATAFQTTTTVPRSGTISRSTTLFITPEEDLELTRKVIQEFEKGQVGGGDVEEVTPAAAEEEEEPEPKKKKAKKAE